MTASPSLPTLPLPALLGLILGLAACSDETLDAAAVARGKALSSTCTTCHHLERPTHQVGPSLQGVLGRTAGTLAGYDYSAGMKASGLIWSPETLLAYLRDPYALVPDTKMAVGELTEAEAADLVVYLQSLD